LIEFLTAKFDIRSSTFEFIFPAVFFVSLATLSFEVLLTRIFSVSQWNHLSFMVLSIALFGFGAAGTFLSIVAIRKKTWLPSLVSRVWLSILLYLFAFSAIFSFLTLNQLPLDYFRLPVDPIQIFYLMAVYLVLALPFFFAGLIISIAYVTVPQNSGFVYFASMAGSALGAVLPIPALPLAGEGSLILFSASISLVPVVYSTYCSGLHNTSRPLYSGHWRLFVTVGLVAFVLLVLFILGVKGDSLTRIKASPYKALSQIMQFPGTHIVESMTSIRGRYDRIQSPYIRYAPGLSLKYTNALPAQDAVFKDADNQMVLHDLQKNPAQAGYAKYLLSYAAYFVRPEPEDVLLIISNGGSAIPCAIASGAGEISIVEQSPQIAGILNRQYSLKIINKNPRVFLAQDNRGYDIIQVENWSTSIPGSSALNQEHFFTIEAFTQYLNHLKPNGWVTISRKLLLPPSDSLRLWATAYEALKNKGINNPGQHLAVLRNFDTVNLLVSSSVIDFKRLAKFAATRNFDLVYLPGMDRELANRFNIFDSPYHYEEINRLEGMYRTGRQNDFFHHYLLDVAPQSDNRPFPGRFLKWSKIQMLYRSVGNRLYALFMSGEIVVMVVFVEAMLIALVLLVIPLLASTRKARKPKISQVTYFLAVGTGFMFTELYFIKRFIILVGDPIISFAAVIAGILFFSGLGGIWVHHKPRQNIKTLLAVLIAVLVFEAFLFELLLSGILKLSIGMHYAAIGLILLPTGFLMGLPFPLGMRYLLDTPVQRAYAWSVNGCASVLSSIMAVQVAIGWGIPQIAGFAVVAYLVALVSVRYR
jgi:hypothetical protein